MAKRVNAFVVLLLAASIAGCGRGRVPVEGVVTLDGKPLAGATVTLLGSEGSSHERTFLGETDADGHFQILTANGKATGAPPGEYSLFVTSVKIPPDVNELTKLPPERVPANWRDGSQSFTVPVAGTTDVTLAITTRR